MIKTDILRTIPDIKRVVAPIKRQNLALGLVPTMGALHPGHESLIKKAKQECDAVIVSIFVNPTQFGRNEDFGRYPRQLDIDGEICAKYDVDYIFAPPEQEIYPEKYTTTVVPPDFYRDRLCGKTRVGHFNGAATVVLKLFNIITPDRAYFGEKDAQQLIIIKKMVKDLNLDVEITACPTVRDADGLALSSRNTYLNEKSREKALTLYKALQKALQTGDIDDAKSELDDTIELEYFEEANFGEDRFIAIAAGVDGVRLIDNVRL